MDPYRRIFFVFGNDANDGSFLSSVRADRDKKSVSGGKALEIAEKSAEFFTEKRKNSGNFPKIPEIKTEMSAICTEITDKNVYFDEKGVLTAGEIYSGGIEF